MRRFWILSLGLVLWQTISVGFDMGEFAYDQAPPVVALLAALVTVGGWVALGVWAGRRSLSTFVWFSLVVWLLILGSLVVVMLALAVEGVAVEPWHEGLIFPILLAGGPLHPLSYYVPLALPIHRSLVVAGAMLVLSVGSYLLTRAFTLSKPIGAAGAS